MRGRLLLVTAVIAAALAASASARTRYSSFDVVYSGSGKIYSQTASQTSPQCGEVTELRTENTHFSWVTHYQIVLGIQPGGSSAERVSAGAERSALGDNSSSVDLAWDGCQSGYASCRGESQPQRGANAVLEVSAAPANGRSRFHVGAVGGFLGFIGRDFEGTWAFTTGSCAGTFDSRELLIPEFGVPAQLVASFPVRYKTLKSLPRGHYFRVRISAGHYAPAYHKRCYVGDGCDQDDFQWHGVVTVTRKS